MTTVVGVDQQSKRAGIAACLTAMTTLGAQVLVHRVVSLKLLNNYAFLVVSLTMLGLGLSGVILTRWLARFVEREREYLPIASAAFAVSLLAVSALTYRSHNDIFIGQSRPDFVIDFARWLPYALLFAVPFTFSGLILGTLLSAPKYPTRRVYFFDLLGSGVGALVILPILNVAGVERALALVALVQIIGAVILFRPVTNLARGSIAASTLLTLVVAIFPTRVLDFYPPEGSPLAIARGTPEVKLLHTTWDPLGRAEVSELPRAIDGFVHPSVFGDDPGFRSRFKRMFTQNNFTWTFGPYYDGTPETLSGIERTFYIAPYIVSSVKNPRVAAIGVGGGSDILAALKADASHITGIEANGGTLRVLKEIDRDYFSKWVNDPRVELVHDEGRHFLASTEERFDVIELSGVDTYAGTPGAAHVFTENYLYTVEAFDLYFSRLTENGIFTVCRAEWEPPREMVRALATAVLMLRRRGIEHPYKHIMMLRSANKLLVDLVVKRTPITEEEQNRALEWARSINGSVQVAAAPKLNDPKGNVYQAFLVLDHPTSEAGFIEAHWANIGPVEDDRPFYFRFSYWWHLFPRNSSVWTQVPYMEMSVIMLFTVIGFVTVLCMWLPLRGLRARTREAELPSTRFAVYFGALGLGYMCIEVSFLQKFGLFLGHPNYALSVVLAGMLLSTGLGALFAERIIEKLGSVRFVAYVLTAIVLVEHLLLVPRLNGLMTMPFIVRAAVAFLLIGPVGTCLGVFMPTGLERLKQTSPSLVPWAWGVNGVFSVLGPVIAIAYSITFGITALLLSSLPLYLIAGWVLGGGSSKPTSKEENPEDRGRTEHVQS